MEGTWHGRREAFITQGDEEGQSCHATGQNPESLCQSLKYANFLARLTWASIIDLLHPFPVTSNMKLQPNVGSDRSWVYKVAADYAENPPTSETLAIRFANSDSEFNTRLRTV
jgi:hypothetical protein